MGQPEKTHIDRQTKYTCTVIPSQWYLWCGAQLVFAPLQKQRETVSEAQREKQQLQATVSGLQTQITSLQRKTSRDRVSSDVDTVVCMGNFFPVT